MSLFDPATLRLLTGFAELYRGFEASFDFALPPDLLAESEAFVKYKGWDEKHRGFFINSKKADFLLTLKVQEQGFLAELNDERRSGNPWYDFIVELPVFGGLPDRIKFESKRMQNGFARKEIAFKTPFHGTESAMKWRDYDIFVAWHVDSTNMFKPWALLANRLLAADMWDTVWRANTKNPGKHLSLSELPHELSAGVRCL